MQLAEAVAGSKAKLQALVWKTGMKCVCMLLAAQPWEQKSARQTHKPGSKK